MVWLSDLETAEGRQRAEALSASLDGQENVYDLFAIIVHDGTAFHGHYFAYIRDTMQAGNWTPSASKKKKQQNNNNDNYNGGRGGRGGRRGGGGGGGQQYKRPNGSPTSYVIDIMKDQPINKQTGCHQCNIGVIGAVSVFHHLLASGLFVVCVHVRAMSGCVTLSLGRHRA